MSAPEFEVQNVYFEQGVLVIGYLQLPTDVRDKGRLVIQHQLRIGLDHPDYGEDAIRLHDRVVRVLKNALEDFATGEPYTPEVEEDDDSERGMGE